MAFSKLTDHIDDLGNHLEAYVGNMVEYYKLSFFKKFMKGFSSLVKLLILGSVFLVFLGFISVAFAILIGSAIGSYAGGFFIVGGVYLIAFFILLIYGKKIIESIFLDKFSRYVFSDDDDDEQDLKEMQVRREIKKDLNEKVDRNESDPVEQIPKEDQHSWRSEL